jgi:hypothetical protein
MVAAEQASMIETMKMRLVVAIEKERKLLESPEKPVAYLSSEIRENFALLARMYHDHFKTQQEMGLEPKATTKVDVTTRGATHEVFSFLTTEEALQLRKLQAEVDAGTIDLVKLYEAAGPIFKAEQEAADRPRLPPSGGR